jgi:hypothetical protein
VADRVNDRIQVFNSSGSYCHAGLPCCEFSGPEPVAILPGAVPNIYVADTYNNRIQVYDTIEFTWIPFGSYGSGNGQFNRPYGSPLIQQEISMWLIRTIIGFRSLIPTEIISPSGAPQAREMVSFISPGGLLSIQQEMSMWLKTGIIGFRSLIPMEFL